MRCAHYFLISQEIKIELTIAQLANCTDACKTNKLVQHNTAQCDRMKCNARGALPTQVDDIMIGVSFVSLVHDDDVDDGSFAVSQCAFDLSIYT